MKNSKKILSAVLASAMILTLTACGGDANIGNTFNAFNTMAESPAEDFEYEYNDEFGGIEITSYIGNSSVVKIPAKIDGERVVAIGGIEEYYYGAFAYCEGLTSVIIPNGVTTIGDAAFAGCTELTSVTIPNSVTTIGYYAFGDCTGLTSITIPDTVTTIGEDAFFGCTNLDLEAVLGEKIFSEYVLDSKIVSANTLASNIKNRVTEFFTKMDAKKATYVGGVQTFTLTAVQTANGSDWVLSGSSASMWKDGVDHANSNPVNTKNVTTRDTQLAAYIADTLADMKQCCAVVYIGETGKVMGVVAFEGESTFPAGAVIPSSTDFTLGYMTWAGGKSGLAFNDIVIGTAPVIAHQ